MTTPEGYLPRLIDAPLAAALTAAPVVILDGPRGAGKTTTARRIAATTIMLPRDLPAVRSDPDAYLRSAAAPVLIDEWQLAGVDLLWAIKAIVDDDPTPGRFILTGSVEPASSGATFPLTARAVRLVIRPMTWAELNGRGDSLPFLSRVVQGAAPVVGAGVAEPIDLQVLGRAGFPGARTMGDPTLFLDAYASLVAQRAGDEGRDATRLLRTMRVLATMTGQATADQRLWEAADINKTTFKAYDDLLLRVHLAAPLPAFASNRLKRLTEYPKRFLADTAMALTLAELSTDDLQRDPTLAGRYLQSFVMQQLRPQVDRVRGSLMHLRTAGGEREIDAVIEAGSTLIGMQVKLGRRPSRADAKPLEWLRDQLGDRFTHGHVVHTGSDAYPLGDRVSATPLALVMG